MAGSVVEDRGDWLVVRTLANPTFWWGNFLLFPTPPATGDIRRWITVFRTEFPDAVHRAFGVDGTAGETGSQEELKSLGVTADVSIVLTATSLKEPPPPKAVCRRLAGTDDWAQALQLRLAVDNQPDTEAYRMFLRRRVQEAMALAERGHGAWYGAFVEGRMASALGIVTDGSGVARYQSVESHPDYRRRGLARRLIYEAARYAIGELAAATVVILADPEYHAIELYRSLGFIDTERHVQLHGPAPDRTRPGKGGTDRVV